MRKLKLLLIALTMLIGGGNLAWGQTAPTASTPVVGNTYYLYNPTTKLFMTTNVNLPFVRPTGCAWKLEDGKQDEYITLRLKDNTTDGCGYFWGKWWANDPAQNSSSYSTEREYKLVNTSGANYKLQSYVWGESNSFIYINNGNEGDRSYRLACNSHEQGSLDEGFMTWQFISEEDYATYMEFDKTSLIKNNDFLNGLTDWTAEGSGNKQAHGNTAVEYWNSAASTGGFDYYQTLSSIPNGKYVLRAAMYNSTNGEDGASFNSAGQCGVYGTSGGVTKNANVTVDGTAYNIYTTDGLFVTDGNLRLGVKNSTTMTARWFGVDWIQLCYYGNAVSLYSPTSFDGDDDATASTWYAFTVVSTGVYKITSTTAATISYTQDDSDDADDDVSTISIPTSGKAIVELSEGTFYFKSSAASTITITAATNDLDITDMINNAAVTSTTGWTNGRTNSGDKFTGAPDETYMDTWNDTRSQNQDVTLPAGYYLLKCATRGDATISTNPNIYVYSYTSDSNLGKTNIHLEGSAGNLLDKGWAWTYVPFTLSSAGKVGIGFWANCEDGKWAGADDFHLTYYTSELAMKQGHLAQVVADANAWGDKISTTTALETALAASAPSCSSVSDCNTAISNLTSLIATARSTVNAYADFVRAKSGADAMVLVENTNASAASTLTSVASAQSTAAEAAETLSDVNTALSTLRTAIKTFISSAEPSNDGEYFDITCLMENPNFDGDITKWTYASAPGVAWSNCEYYQTEFDINQTVTGLPTGSYSLNVQAFQRPGWADAVWTAYNGGTDNATSVLYINSITSKVKNIAADAQSTAKLGTSNWGTWPNDSRVGSEGSYKYLPNSQQGAKLYFDSNLYDATCAAVVTSADEGSLKLGFKSTADHVDGDWTIFDNFRLRYYGSSLFIYYKQYLPQLKDEVSADLSNGTYTNVFVSSENEALEAALDAEPEAETEEAYEDVINDILNAQTAFRNAKTAYDAMVAAKAYSALTKVSDNIGSNPFQYNATTNNSLFIAYETAKAAVDDYTFTTSSTAAGAQTLVDALDDAIDAYNNQTLNVPDGEKEYALVVATSGHSREGKSVIITLGSTSPNNPTGYSFTAQSESIGPRIINFTQVSGNNYNISYQTDGSTTVYLTYGSLNGSAAGWKNQQIQGTTDTDKKGTFRIEATTTDNVFKIWNTVDENYIDCQDNGSIYTDNNITADEFTLQEITSMTIAEDAAADPEQRVANVTLKRAFNKGWNAVCLPFSTPAFDDAEIAEFSSETKVDNNVTIKLKKVDKFIANTPYLVYFPEAVAANKTFNAVAVDPTDVKKEGTDFDFLGTFKCKDIETGDWVISSGILRKAVATINLKPLRTYFVQKVNEARSLDFSFDDDTTTSITVIERDGQMEIVNDAYNLSGQKVNGQLKKGIYIINGKKTVIK